MRFFKRLRAQRRCWRRNSQSEIEREVAGMLVSDGTGLTGEGFFSQGRWKARVANRRKFRVAVSGNRKWIFLGIAVVAVCGTIIYLSVTYGGGIMGLLK